MNQTQEAPVQTSTSSRLPSKAYAAMGPSENLVPWDFTRRIPRPHDSLGKIERQMDGLLLDPRSTLVPETFSPT